MLSVVMLQLGFLFFLTAVGMAGDFVSPSALVDYKAYADAIFIVVAGKRPESLDVPIQSWGQSTTLATAVKSAGRGPVCTPSDAFVVEQRQHGEPHHPEAEP